MATKITQWVMAESDFEADLSKPILYAPNVVVEEPTITIDGKDYKITRWEMSFTVLRGDDGKPHRRGECPAYPGESCRWAQEMARRAADRRSSE